MSAGNRASFYIQGSSETEKRGMQLIRECFGLIYPQLVMREVHGSDPTAIFLQKHLGDIIWFNADPSEHSGFSFAEVKVEERYTGNLFVETWSNWADEPEKLNPGWSVKVAGHWLFYVFLDRNIIYMLPRHETLRFVWKHHEKFPERTQGKAHQKNKTRGVLVPIEILRDQMAIGGTTLQCFDMNAISRRAA
jgi:hypothetical protein